jgi:hypothetical protein
LGLDLAQFFTISRSTGEQSLLPYRGFGGPWQRFVGPEPVVRSTLGRLAQNLSGFTEENYNDE